MITVLGASGFIGSELIIFFKKNNINFYSPKRDENLTDKNLGDIIYCIGLTSDFRTKPFETIEAHICKLCEVLSTYNFTSLTYLSSTRVYINSTNNFANEDDKIIIDPHNADDLYNLSKLTGERLCLSSGKKVKIVRLSNVIGNSNLSNNFLFEIINEIKNKNEIEFYQTENSSKDFIHIDDVVQLLYKISISNSNEIYNIASGINTSILQIVTELKKYYTFSYTINKNAKETIFPIISNEKIISEFNYIPQQFSAQLSKIFN